ncbi:hypothetical protein KP509_22G031600 [Ceratopteris richardii]|uniref:Uncharacterized protein n=1 Tax=Ceratopteris richardii TaxID=49495 RepID=A0A8T2S3R3_CERRI|nr:hypothetical protein KP509_22G031600 [Ceratopteris richardii]
MMALLERLLRDQNSSSALENMITELQAAHGMWSGFKEGLLDALSLDDLSKRLSISQTLTSFEDKFEQLSIRDRTLFFPEKVMIFLQVKDRKDLGLVLEDPEGVNGLVRLVY